jgi:hypothetical protein
VAGGHGALAEQGVEADEVGLVDADKRGRGLPFGVDLDAQVQSMSRSD